MAGKLAASPLLILFVLTLVSFALAASKEQKKKQEEDDDDVPGLFINFFNYDN